MNDLFTLLSFSLLLKSALFFLNVLFIGRIQRESEALFWLQGSSCFCNEGVVVVRCDAVMSAIYAFTVHVFVRVRESESE